MARLPLEGIRIADITVVWAGPYCTAILADWGAEVVRVESRQHMQVYTRGIQARPTMAYVTKVMAPYGYGGYKLEGFKTEGSWNRWPLFTAHARNKLSMTVDLTRPEGRDIFLRLIKKSDVFVESNPPMVKESLNIGYEVLKEVNPRLIMLSMPGFGQYGPYRGYRALGAHQEGFIGHTYLRGYPDMDIATSVTLYHTDEAAGASGALAVLMALYYRERTGKGQFIDMAQAEATMPELGEAIMDYTMNGRIQERTGNRDIHGAVQGCYLCQGAEPGPKTPPGQDKWVNITIFNDAQWDGFCRALGNPEWTRDARFATQLDRLQHHDELDRLIGQWTRQHDHYAVMYALQREGVPAGPVLDDRDAYNDPHIKERGFFNEVTQVDLGTYLHPGMTFKMSRIANRLRLPPCRLGEHNDYVYKKVIVVSEEEYARLEKEGHIGMDFVPEIP